MTGPIIPSRTRCVESFTVENLSATVTAAKQVSKGERLVIRADGEKISLDALLLESLVWQTGPGPLSDLVESGELVTSDQVAIYGGDPREAITEFTIANEYSQVVVSKVETDAGEGLQLAERGIGTTVLGTESLRALAEVPDTFRFSDWFRTPTGPEPSI